MKSFDLDKFLHVFKGSLIYIIAVFILSSAVAYLGFVRWSKPVYESSSVLKLDFESEATTLGLGSNVEAMELAELSGEIELLKSKLFFSRVADVVEMDVSYYYYGNVLEDERYNNSPFKLTYELKNLAFYDRPIDLEILDNDWFVLSYA